MNSLKKWEIFTISNKWTEYKTLTRSRRIKNIEREVRRTYRKITGDSKGVEKKKLLFKTEG